MPFALVPSISFHLVSDEGKTTGLSFQGERLHQFAKKQIHQLVEGVFAPRDVVLPQDGGELVIFLLLIAGRDGVKVGQ